MSETGWTPGPWGIGDGNEVFAVGAGRSVALVCAHSEGEANAHLIAAAPDLYEALDRAARTFRSYEAMHAEKSSLEGDVKARANAIEAEHCEAALAHARGEDKP